MDRIWKNAIFNFILMNDLFDFFEKIGKTLSFIVELFGLVIPDFDNTHFFTF